jgi:hypothetical protein
MAPSNEAFVSLELSVRLAVMRQGGSVATMRVRKNMHGKRCVAHTANHAWFINVRMSACVLACVSRDGKVDQNEAFQFVLQMYIQVFSLETLTEDRSTSVEP